MGGGSGGGHPHAHPGAHRGLLPRPMMPMHPHLPHGTPDFTSPSAARGNGAASPMDMTGQAAAAAALHHLQQSIPTSLAPGAVDLHHLGHAYGGMPMHGGVPLPPPVPPPRSFAMFNDPQARRRAGMGLSPSPLPPPGQPRDER